MKHSIHSNGWTVLIHEDIRDLSKDELKTVGKLCAENMVVVFDQSYNITPEEQMECVQNIGTVRLQGKPPEGRHAAILLRDGIIRVTGKLNEKGEPGLFGHKSALEWHANSASNKDRKPIVWMYGAEGMKGSRTSFLNMIQVYENLPNNFKKSISNLKCYFGYEHGKYTTTEYFHPHVNKELPFDIVMTTTAGKTGLYYPFYQVFGMEGLLESEFKEVHDELVNHILQEKYMYHHDWEDGQIILSDQWLSLHKRWEFDGMEDRILHRIALDYSKVYSKYP